MSQPAPHRHEPLLKIASGGMATVFLGSLQGALGFRQIVAIKRPHPHLLENEGFREELLREARLASGIHHANVVDVRDVEVVGDSIQLVMDYIEGASLGELVHACAQRDRRVPPAIAVRVVLDACAGLHAAHELADDAGRPLGLVHRDVSPQNILVGVDGVARVTDFGIAKCAQGSDPGTSRGSLKGKIGYMAPEYVHGMPLDRRADVFAAGVVLWEVLCGQRLFRGQSDGETLERVLSGPVPRVSSMQPELAAFDGVVERALRRERADRFASIEAFATELERVALASGLLASHGDVGRFVREMVGDRLEARRRALREARQDDPPSGAPVRSDFAPASAKSPDPLPETLPEGRVLRPSRRLLPWLALPAACVAISAVVLAARARRLPVDPAHSANAAPMTPSSSAPRSPSISPSTPTSTPTPTPTPTSPPTSTSPPTPRAHPVRSFPLTPPARSHQPPPNPYPAAP